jgi:hypothetical protein
MPAASFIHKLRKLAPVMVIVVLLLSSCDPSSPDADPEPGSTQPTSSTTSPEIAQASWKIAVKPAPIADKISKSRKNNVKKEGARIEELVKDIYDALFLTPSEAGAILKGRFIPSALNALERSKSGIPADATDVKTLRRRAVVRIETGSLRLGVASVGVKAKGTQGDKKFTIVHEGRLWIEKIEGRWTVVAFEVNQRPVR